MLILITQITDHLPKISSFAFRTVFGEGLRIAVKLEIALPAKEAIGIGLERAFGSIPATTTGNRTNNREQAKAHW